MRFVLAIDFGSTNTKIVAIDWDEEKLLGTVQSPTTLDPDIMVGLQNGMKKMNDLIGINPAGAANVLACSSAAGGLRMVAVGLVKQLTTRVAEEAALGAGAKMVGSYSYGLAEDDIYSIEQTAPDIILLTGGTDGGDKQTLINNARAIAGICFDIPVVIAGNKNAASEARRLLESGGKPVTVVPNVLPDLEHLNVEPAREAIREIFMRRIVHAKGLDKARTLAGEIIMPTPMAVLRAARLLAEGVMDEPGLGDLFLVDVGGATTDVFSIANGYPSRPGVVLRGLREPFAKRTVEGDLGIRYNAGVILQKAGEVSVRKTLTTLLGDAPRLDLAAETEYLASHVERLPQDREQEALDLALAHTAVDLATRRHAGKIEEVYFPSGKSWVQQGKDLTPVKYIIGTGGVLAHGPNPLSVMQAGIFNVCNPESLRPVSPEFWVDKEYILYAVGLAAALDPAKALRIIKKNMLKA